tara:strand:- start:332 stop:1375 length:1044 start_codon:yes stop_codon:yes gene_type:complete
VSTKNIEQLVHRILSKKQVLSYGNDLLVLYSPSLDLQVEADIVYQDIYEANLYNDFILEEDLIQYLIGARILLPQHEEIIKNTETQLDNAKIQLYKEYIDIKKTKRNKKKIESLKKQINKLYMSVHTFDFLVLEHLARTVRHEYILKNTLFYKDSNTPFFPAKQDISYVVFTSIIDIISKNMLDITDLKKVARSEYWKNYYSNNQNNIFPYSASEYSDEQKSLINVSSMYDKISEHPEAPEEQIINDDDALDGWMIHNQRQNKQQKKEKGVDTMMNDKIKNSKEVFLMTGNDEQQKQDILDLNSIVGRNKIKNRFDALSQKDQVDEAELPDVRGELAQQLRELNRKN